VLVGRDGAGDPRRGSSCTYEVRVDTALLSPVMDTRCAPAGALVTHGHHGPCAWPVLQFLGGLAATIFLDIVHISIFYQRTGFSDTERFGAGMAILSLLLKPLSCCFVYHMYRERGGELLLHIGFLGPSQERSDYQTIDSSEAPADPFGGSESRGHAPQGY
uniref:type-1 angiotensin II receptor-associated protein n=1 Tax=Panthera onca TaxID=9690 RepID=UPI00295462DC